MNDGTHVPVLLAEVMQALDIKPDAVMVDATYGRGGHAAAILDRLSDAGRLLILDRDPQAVADARRRFAADRRVSIAQSRFSLLGTVCERQGFTGRVNGIVFDLGVSSPQLDEPGRGFGFSRAAPLDMRMDQTSGQSAAEWINAVEESELFRVLRDYGEERYARRIARAIVHARSRAPITDTRVLAEIVARAMPARERNKDPATRTFQAIRLQVNRELEELDQALPQTLRVLAPGGCLAVISFHSLEDRQVKHFMRAQSRGPDVPREMPAPATPFEPRLRTIGRAIRPSAEEIRRNPRARSAVLRVAQRTEAADG